MSKTRYDGVTQRDARARAAAKLPAPCPRCGGLVTTEMNWHADHWPISRDEAKAQGIPLSQLEVWPAHASCNVRANHRTTPRRAPRVDTIVSRPAIGECV